MDAANYTRYNLRPRSFTGRFTTSQPAVVEQRTPRKPQKSPKRKRTQETQAEIPGTSVPVTPEEREPASTHVKRRRITPAPSTSSSMTTTPALPTPNISINGTPSSSRHVHWGEDSVREFSLHNPIFSLSSGPSPTQEDYAATQEQRQHSLGSPFTSHKRTMSRTISFPELRELELTARDFDSHMQDVETESPKTQFDEILPNLYLGSYSVLKREHRQVLVDLGITKIYSIQRPSEVDKNETNEISIWTKAHNIEWQWIPLRNNPQAELLDTFPELVEDIRQYVQSDKPVFIHSMAGDSRAPAVVIAALMKWHYRDKSHVYVYKSFESLYSTPLQINSGFLRQLLIWHEIKESWDSRWENARYRYWAWSLFCGIDACPISLPKFLNKENKRDILLSRGTVFTKKIVERCKLDYFLKHFPIGVEEGQSVSSLKKFPKVETPEGCYYRCRRCECPLAPANLSFSFEKNHDPVNGSCDHLFLATPVKWMEKQLDTSLPGGMLFCPNCRKKGRVRQVGEYCWIGIQCQGCGEAVAPGVTLLTRVVEDEKPKFPVELVDPAIEIPDGWGDDDSSDDDDEMDPQRSPLYDPDYSSTGEEASQNGAVEDLTSTQGNMDGHAPSDQTAGPSFTSPQQLQKQPHRASTPPPLQVNPDYDAVHRYHEYRLLRKQLSADPYAPEKPSPLRRKWSRTPSANSSVDFQAEDSSASVSTPMSEQSEVTKCIEIPDDESSEMVRRWSSGVFMPTDTEWISLDGPQN